MTEPAGQPFGKYLLLERIAAGGMAEVFRAKYVAAAGVTKTVVLKKILPHYAGNQAFVSMFINEAKIAVGLSHGNIAQVFDFGEVDGEYYLAMELVHGQALSRVARRARELKIAMPLPVTIHVVSQACCGLHYAHTRTDDRGQPLGIVHRDVSPQNVLVGYEGEVKLIDFGIAKARSAGEGGETEHGAIKGKYVYFSPEQARAKPLDGRSDVFAAGIVLYELLTGRRPFDGKMLDVLQAIVRGEFQPPSALVPEMPPELEAIVLKALALLPEERFATALEMHEALQHYLYLQEPGFSASQVGHFMCHLFRQELQAEGSRFVVPADFPSQLERWKSFARLPPEGSGNSLGSWRGGSRSGQVSRSWQSSVRQSSVLNPSLSNPGRSFSQPGAHYSHTGQTDAVARPPKPKKRSWLWAGAGLGAGVLAAAGFLLLSGRPASYTLSIDSQPAGARILIDGVDTRRVSPGRIEGLVAGEPHQVELVLDGRQPWRAQLPPQSGSEVELQAALDPLAAAQPARPVAGEDVRDPLEPALPPGPVAALPEKSLTLLAAQHAANIPASPAARLRLDPGRTYRLSVEGQSSLEGTGSEQRLLRGVFFFGERVPGTPAAGSYGQLRPDAPAKVRGLRALYGFILDVAPADNRGTLRINVVDEQSGAAQVLLVDPTRHFIARTSRFARFTGLDPTSAYRLSVTGSAELGADGGAVSRLLYFAEAGDDPRLARGGQGAFDAETPAELSGVRGVWLMLPDDDLFDNSGELKVGIEPIKYSGR